MWQFLRDRYIQDAGHLVLGVIMCICLIGSLSRIYATDEVQYYAWVRSLWKDHDVNFQNEYETFAHLNPESGIQRSLLQPNRIRPLTGFYGNIAPVGSAILWAPWFITTDVALQGLHAIGLAQQIPADGYSWPYQRAVCYASAIYAFLGLLICRRLAQQWADQRTATIATVGIWLATPLVYYMTIQMPFAHANGFFVTSCFVWLWWKTQQHTPDYRYWLWLGLCGGMLYMVREQLILMVVLPAITVLVESWRLWKSSDSTQLKQYVIRVSICIVMFVGMLVPQFAAYWAVNGTPLPAREVSSKLNLCSPHALDTLIDFDPAPAAYCNVGVEPVSVPAWSRGALVWSPIIAFALIGLALFAWSNPLIGGAMLLAFALQVWINGAFGTTWHLSGAFGFRRFVECSPLFIVGLATLLNKLQARISVTVLGVIVALFICWNFGLVANATLFNGETQLRRGLTWPHVWHWQFSLPQRIWERSMDLFDRCKLVKNSCS